MLRRGLGVAAVLLVFAAPARRRDTRARRGALRGRHPARQGGSGRLLLSGRRLDSRIGSSRATAARVELRNVSMFNGRVTVRRLVVPSRVASTGARVDGLVVDGTGYVVGPNAIIPLDGGSYIVALQEAVSPGRTGSGLVALRAFVSDPSLGLAPGTQLLVGLARAAHPDSATSRAAAVLGLPQLPAAQASMAGVPTFLEPEILPPTNTLGGQAVALAYRFLGVPYVWGGDSPVRLRLLRAHDVRLRRSSGSSSATTPASSTTRDCASRATSCSRETSCSSTRTRPACRSTRGCTSATARSSTHRRPATS